LAKELNPLVIFRCRIAHTEYFRKIEGIDFEENKKVFRRKKRSRTF